MLRAGRARGWCGLSLLVVVAGAIGAPAVASAGPLSFAPLPAFSDTGGSALSDTGGSAPASASAGTSGCTNRAATSNFHPNLNNPNIDAHTVLPLEQLPADAVSVPTWSGSFTSDGTTYPFTMVGTDPTAGSTTTHVPVEIVPLSLDFAGSGCVLSDSAMTADLEASPLFAPMDLPPGARQYLDSFRRANFWSTVSTVSPGHHLLLDPTDIPAVTLHVPAAQGLTAYNPSTNRAQGIVNGHWLYNQLVALLNSLHISPTTFAVFVPYNTYVTDQNPNDCLTPTGCYYYTGYHQAVLSDQNPHAINTFALASYTDYGTFLNGQFDDGTLVLSHEMLEWADDPFDHGARIQGQGAFLMNTAPAWGSPYYAGGRACTTPLEVADPLEGFGALYVPGLPTNWLLADGAFLSWFARQSPSTAYAGLYDLGGIFNTYSTAC